MKPKIFVSYPLANIAIEKLQQHFDVTVNPEKRVLSSAELIQQCKDKEGILCLLTDTIDKALIDACPSLKAISNYAVGYNNIDINAVNNRKIPVYYTPGVLTEATADLTFALILATTRRVVEADAFLRAGKFTGWTPDLFLGFDINGKTLGIVGMGRIGLAVARRAKAFNMSVIYSANSDKTLPDYQYATLDEVLKTADVISLHLPYNEKNHHLIDAQRLSQMKKTAYLINTARGPIVDEAALAKALIQGQIAGAGLDVFEEEPTVQPDLLKLSQVVLLPHIGSATHDTRGQMALMAADNLIQFFFGSKTNNVINPEVLKELK
jgi:glyoxylate reductase